MNTFLKANKNLKSQKATVIVLSLFLIFFVSSIIGIIYSYNKRIFQLAKQERDNYKVFKKQFDEMFANLYMVDLIKLGWQIVGSIGSIQNLDLISISSVKRYSRTCTYSGSSSYSTINLSVNFDINNDTFYLSFSNPEINHSYNFDLPTEQLKKQKNDIADKLKYTYAIEKEIERDLKKLLGNIKILKFDQDSDNHREIDNKIKKGDIGKLKYTVIIQKNIKTPQGKEEKESKPKYQIDLEYEVLMPGYVTVNFPSSIVHTSSTTYTIYNPNTGQYEQHTKYHYDNNISMDITATLNSYSNLTKFEIKKIK
jgi:hypothetical protein